MSEHPAHIAACSARGMGQVATTIGTPTVKAVKIIARPAATERYVNVEFILKI